MTTMRRRCRAAPAAARTCPAARIASRCHGASAASRRASARRRRITVTADPALPQLTPAQRTAATTYQENVAKLQRTFTGALEQANNMRTRTQAIRRALVDSPADVKLMDQAVQFDRRVARDSSRAARRRNAARHRVGLADDDPGSRQFRRRRDRAASAARRPARSR